MLDLPAIHGILDGVFGQMRAALISLTIDDADSLFLGSVEKFKNVMNLALPASQLIFVNLVVKLGTILVVKDSQGSHLRILEQVVFHFIR